MCGIIGSFGSSLELAQLVHRGRDDSGSWTDHTATFGHVLHSIVGKVAQPIETEHWVVGANCELYNWKKLAQLYNITCSNDAELLAKLIEQNFNFNQVIPFLEELDGDYAFFAYHKESKKLLLARDIFGVKPLWFSTEGGFQFASEHHVLNNPEELNPRNALIYDGEISFINRPFVEAKEGDVQHLMEEAILKRIPSLPVGILFSGGIDSTLILHVLHKKVPCRLYFTTNKGNPEIDIVREIAKHYDTPLTIVYVDEEKVLEALPKVMDTINSADPVRVEAGLTMHFALEAASEKVMFSGIGADDVFAGYQRMQMDKAINEDIVSQLRRIYERDLYRDDALAMRQTRELRVPFLDLALINACLAIPSSEKRGIPKQHLREIAMALGVPEKFAIKPKKAAQYSSGVSKIIKKLQGKNRKGPWFAQHFSGSVPKLCSLLSSGKDSVYALHLQKRMNYEIACCLSIKSDNKDSYMFHTPAISLAALQAEAMGIPLIEQHTSGHKEEELKDLKEGLARAKREYGVTGVITGALYSNYQRSRIEQLCDELNLKCYSPLWHMNQEHEMRNLLREGFEIMFTKVAAYGLNKAWVGRLITDKDVDQLVQLREEIGLNVAGEGGEFESLVLDAPLFSKKLILEEKEVKEYDENTAELLVTKASLKSV